MWTLKRRDTRKDLPARDGTSCGLGRDHAWQQHDRRIKEGQEPSLGAVGTIRARREGLCCSDEEGAGLKCGGAYRRIHRSVGGQTCLKGQEVRDRLGLRC